MIKEIFEQPDTILSATNFPETELKSFIDTIKSSRNIYTVGCGTAGFAAAQIAYYLRKISNISATELKAYEIESYKDIINENDLVIAISQSGETADTIEAIELFKEKGGKVASLVNMIGSTITRISDYKFFSRNGPEICVASTKAFTAQIAWGFLLAMTISNNYDLAVKQIKSTSLQLVSDLETIPNSDAFKILIDKIKGQEHFFVLGRGQNFQIALEAALKIKEITYKHFEGFTAGELKHGIIALIDKGTPVFGIISEDNQKHEMISALSEVKARGAFIIGISSKPNELFDIFIKVNNSDLLSPILNILPFQLIAYYLGKNLGLNVDKPKNLAKSVTVK